MSPRLAIGQTERLGAGSRPAPTSWLSRWDGLASVASEVGPVRWATRLLLFGLALFALTGPHSIAAAHLSLSLSLGAWIVRDLAARRFHFARTPLDWPLLCFAGWTLLSAVFSIEPRESLPKLRSLLLFGVIYIVATNLQARGVRFFVALLMASSLAGVGYSLIEKISGRGMILTAISADSPLASSPLQPGDVIWMIARHRVSSLEDAAPIIRRYGPGARLEIEALHAGDPLPVDLLVTDALKARSNPLGLSVNGRSRRFRVSGFTRHFVTYAEQMQLLTLLVFGWMLAGLKSRRPRRHLWLSACLALFALFSLTLILTASRSAIASCLLTLIAVSIIVGGRRAALISLLAVLALTSFAVYTLRSSRALSAVSFTDDSTERRLGYMRAGLRLIPQHPLLGVGMDAHKRHWTAWGFPGDYVTHTHSTPIQIAMDRGLPALGCYVWLMVAMFVLTWRGYARARQLGDEAGGFRLGAFAMLIGFSASSLVNYNFGDAETLLMLLFVIGLSVADQAFPKNQPDRSDGLGPQATDAPALSGEPASGHQIKFIDAYRHIG